MIEGVIISKKKQIVDDRGKIMQMLRNDDQIFNSFGEIYFSCINENKIKAWHLHKKMTLNYSVIHGKIKLVLFDDRDSSSTKGMVEEILLSPEDHCLVTIPPLIWNGFISLFAGTSVVANCTDIPHDKSEIIRKDFNDDSIPYNWE